MKINRDSWHYKLVHFGSFEHINTSLCFYFWCVIGKLIMFSIGLSLIGLFIYGIITEPEVRFVIVVVSFVIACFFLPVFAIHTLRYKLHIKTELPKENLIVEFIKAKKAKLCPLIKFVN
jgi:hypothetical protein